jgi:hypothetical protein
MNTIKKQNIIGTLPRAEHALIRILKLLFAARQETSPTKREREEGESWSIFTSAYSL